MHSQQLSVVIVDKHPMMRIALSAALASADKVNILAEYATSRDFLRVRQSAAPNMILLGIGNPGNEELVMIRLLRHTFPMSKVLVLISGELPGQQEEALRYGAHYVLEKTISRDELLDTLNRRFTETALWS